MPLVLADGLRSDQIFVAQRAGDGAGDENAAAAAAAAARSSLRGPHFDTSAQRNVTALVGRTARLHCRIHNLGNRTVSWVRHRDIHLLTVGRYTYTSDQRFQSIHAPQSDDWVLQIRYPQHRDSGLYECQTSVGFPLILFDRSHPSNRASRVKGMHIAAEGPGSVWSARPPLLKRRGRIGQLGRLQRTRAGGEAAAASGGGAWAGLGEAWAGLGEAWAALGEACGAGRGVGGLGGGWARRGRDKQRGRRPALRRRRPLTRAGAALGRGGGLIKEGARPVLGAAIKSHGERRLSTPRASSPRPAPARSRQHPRSMHGPRFANAH
ncbi:Uncharacterized protein GBIM_05583 [Gryllus bimaculatus]|nr:Uncharacterized protein GBIM_05583 [Gryllus bimaculatus]